MADPRRYQSPVVATTPWSTIYENGWELPREGQAAEHADIFEGQQRYTPQALPQFAGPPDAGVSPIQAVDGSVPDAGYQAQQAQEAQREIGDRAAADYLQQLTPRAVPAPTSPAPIAAPPVRRRAPITMEEVQITAPIATPRPETNDERIARVALEALTAMGMAPGADTSQVLPGVASAVADTVGGSGELRSVDEAIAGAPDDSLVWEELRRQRATAEALRALSPRFDQAVEPQRSITVGDQTLDLTGIHRVPSPNDPRYFVAGESGQNTGGLGHGLAFTDDPPANPDVRTDAVVPPAWTTLRPLPLPARYADAGYRDAGVPPAAGVPLQAPIPTPAPVPNAPIASEIDGGDFTPYTQEPYVPAMGTPVPRSTLTPEQIEARNRAQLPQNPALGAPTRPTAPQNPDIRGAGYDSGAGVASQVPYIGAGQRPGAGAPPPVTTIETQLGVPVDPTLLSNLRENVLNQGTAAQALAAHRATQARERGAQLAEHAAEQGAIIARNQQAEALRTAAARSAENDYRAAVGAFETQTVDPARWYHERGTPGTIIAAIAMGLGAFSQSLTGGENTAFKIIQSAIADDIDAQKSNIEASGKRIALKGNLLSEMRARFTDERSAELAAEAAMMRHAAATATALEAQSVAVNGPIEGHLLVADLNTAATRAEIELQNRAADRATIQTRVAGLVPPDVRSRQGVSPVPVPNTAPTGNTQVQEGAATGVGYEPNTETPTSAVRAAHRPRMTQQQVAAAATRDHGVQPVYIGGYNVNDVRGALPRNLWGRLNERAIDGARIVSAERVLGLDTATQRAAATDVANMTSFNRIFTQIIDYAREHGRSLSPTVKAHMEGLRRRAIYALSGTTNSGIINPGELPVYERQVPDPTNLFNVAGIELLKTVRDSATASMNDRLRTVGYLYAGPVLASPADIPTVGAQRGD